MYFYVFLQPELFEEAASDGEDAKQNVIATLNGFLQNCFLAVFEDGRWGISVGEKLKDWPATMARKRVKSLLVQLKNKGRFLYCITPDYMGLKPDIECVFEQVDSIPLDLALVTERESNRAGRAGVEVITRRTYHESGFEQKRSNLAAEGKTCLPGEMGEVPFMDFHFARALKHATIIHICDRFCGSKNFRENFRYTTQRLLAWLATVLADPADCRIVFHLGQPEGKGEEFIREQLDSFKTGALSDAVIEVQFYDVSSALPHQRFILADQIALGIDRGLDFLDQKTRKCRDTHVNYQKAEDVLRFLNSYSFRQTEEE
jgi:hypothetical protein